MLQQIKSYKNLFTLTLFVVYAFVITPTNFWHSHSCKVPNTGKSYKVLISESNADETDANCNFCSHENNAFYNNAFILNFTVTYSYINSWVSHFEHKLPTISITKSNKGPPLALA
jgi:hypothetical protein